MRFHSATAMPPHTVSALFTAQGDASNSGVGEVTETWAAEQRWMWSAKLGSFAVIRYGIGGENFDDHHVDSIPMRAHMMRNAIFWAAGSISAGARFRGASVQWNGKPATCVLSADTTPAMTEPDGRGWDEEEYCIDDATSQIQILSPAPGEYTLYGYSKAAQFHGIAIPDHITTYIAGSPVLDATFLVNDAVADQVPAAPTPQMIANGQPVSVALPGHMTLEVGVQGLAATVPVLVNAQLEASGEITEAEVCAAADPSFVAQALTRVKAYKIPPSRNQRQSLFLVEFLPSTVQMAQTKAMVSKLADEPKVRQLPYTIERVAKDPNDGGENHETLARRRDGVKVQVENDPRPVATQWRMILYPDGRRVTLYDAVKAKVSWPGPMVTLPDGRKVTMASLQSKPAQQVTEMADGPASCAGLQRGPTILRKEQIEGVDVEVLEDHVQSMRFTRSAAPTLGCENLRVIVESMQANGSFRAGTETKATRIDLSDPDATLFAIPADYVEMKPSEARKKLMDAADWTGISPQEREVIMRESMRMAEQEDARYVKH